jgi:penicillin-binding protein A
MKKIIPYFKEKNTNKDWSNTSESLYKKMDVRKSIVFRLQIFGLIMLVGMTFVLWRFYHVQIVQQDYYQQRLDTYTQRLYYVNSPRGEILDRNKEVLTSNAEQLVITYLPPLRVSENEKWQLASTFANYFDMNIESMSLNQQKDAFLHFYYDIGYQLLTNQQQQEHQNQQLTVAQINTLIREVLDESHLSRLSDHQKASWLTKAAMDVPSGGRPKPIKENATNEEVAFLIEHLDLFRGFDVAVSWNRAYPFGVTLRTVLGSVTTPTQGLPSESLLSYLALDYARNDIVGRSGLELQYEQLLKGSRSIYNLNYDTSGLGILENLQLGEKGMNIVTSFDINWQLHAESVIERILLEHQNSPYRQYFDTVNFVVMDPNNGDVLVMASITLTENGFLYDPLGTITRAMPIGSSVKGAVVYTGLTEGVVQPNEVIIDQPIKIQDTPLKSSHMNLGRVTDQTAISKSSNIYMFFVAMRLGGANYVYDGPLRINLSTFALMRNYFSQFGLGAYTQIDLPNEQTGYKGTSTLGGLLLDFSIGQYDNYTTIQMAQYASTIANDGKRIAPRVVTHATSSLTGELTYQADVNVISMLDDLPALKRVQSGMRLCVTDDGCRGFLSRLQTPFAAKTGTAQATVVVDGEVFSSPNSTLITYGPYQKPEVATACQVPNAWNTQSQPNICLQITAEILNYRYD